MENNTNIISQQINVGNYEVISSGAVIVPNTEFLEFLFDNLRFKIIFETEKDDNGNLTQGHYTLSVEKDEVTQSEFLKITMFNQNKSFFSSSNTMIPVATLKNRKLLLKFCINSINTQDKEDKEDKIFFYTWFLEKIVDNIKE